MAIINYNKIIRKTVVSFGNIFSNIAVSRYDDNGKEAERFLVRMEYAEKEKYVKRLQGDPDLYKKIGISLPALSYELKTIKYDKNRKLVTTGLNYNKDISNTYWSQFNPVPYDYEFSVYIYVRNLEDGHQILEKVLPYFTPDYNILINLEDEMGITKSVPVVLEGVDMPVESEGDFDSRSRTIIWTLNFSVKGFLYGPMRSAAVIKEAITNIYLDSTQEADKSFYLVLGQGRGAFQAGETIYQGNSIDRATATASVVSYSAVTKKLQIVNITGSFLTNQNVTGLLSGATYNLNNYEITPLKVESVNVQVVPRTANVNDAYSIVTTKTYYNP